MRFLAPGLWVVLATPFDEAYAVDHASLRNQVALARAAGASGVLALGVFGEAESLDSAEQRSVVRTVAAEGLPMVVGLPARSTAVAVEQGRSAAAAAGDPLQALMVQVNAPDPDVVAEHLRRVHDATGAAVVLQDYPVVSGVRIGADALLQVLGRCPFVVAVKAESAPTPPAVARLAADTDVPVFGGLGGVGLVDELACGAAGAMTGFSHPEGLRQTLAAFARGGVQAACDAWAPWLPLANFEGQAGIGLALRKHLLHRRGVLATPLVRPPAPTAPARLLPLADEHLERVAAGGLAGR